MVMAVVAAFAGTVTSTASGLIRISLVNASHHVIRKAYISPTGSASWGPNLLAPKTAGQQPALKGTERADLSLTKECGRFDIRLVADGGTEFLEDDMELCDEDNVLTVTNDALELTKAGRQ